MRNRIIMCFVFISSLTSCGYSSDEGDKYLVGFKYYKLYDSSRQYYYHQDTIDRPLLVHFWYPSQEKSSPNMDYKQYIDLVAIREDFSKSKDQIDKESRNYVNAFSKFAQRNYGLSKDVTANQILDSKVNASLNIDVVDGDFPLIIYAPSNSKESMQNHLIFEKLASHGYYIISVASAGQNSKKHGRAMESISAQVLDMEFILNYFENEIGLNYTGIGVLNYSSGGLATPIFQNKHKKVKATVSLDGGHEFTSYTTLNHTPGYESYKKGAPYYLMTNSEMPSIFPYYTSLGTENKFYSKMKKINHFGFVSFWSFFDGCDIHSTDKNAYVISYGYIVDNVFAFFDFYLKNDQKDPYQLKNKLVKETEFWIDDMEDYSNSVELIHNYLNSNIDSALTLHRKKVIENDINCSVREISILGRMLINLDLDAATKIFEYNSSRFPNSWLGYLDLAYAYKSDGEIEAAKASAQKAKEIDPTNKDVKFLIDELADIK